MTTEVEYEQHRLTDGVSVVAVRTFLSDLKREYPDSYLDMSTEDACQQLVVPRTKQPNCAYVDLLRRESPQDVNKATVFVSHAWRYKITDVLNTLLEFAEEQEEKEGDGNPVFFWFDLFMNNQNINVTANLPQDWWSTTFKESIASIGRVLLVLMPWHDPVPLTRAWCLWEIFCGISNKGTVVDIRLPQREEEALQEAIREKYDSVTDMLVRVQAQRAEARSENDKAMIFKAIKTWAGGFEAVNRAVKDQLRAWCLGKAMAAVEAVQARPEGQTTAVAALCYQVASVLYQFGEHDRAINIYETARQVYEDTLGECHPSTASTYVGLGSAYDSRGEYDRAIEHYEKAQKTYIETLGEMHPSMAITFNNLGNSYTNKGDYDSAIECHKKACKIRAKVLGEQHPSTATSYINLGIACKHKGEYEMAIEYYEKARGIYVETLGEKHPHVATTYGNMGIACQSKGDFSRAIQYYERAREVYVQTVGEAHPSTASTYIGLGNAYASMGEYGRAAELLEKAQVIKVKTLGEKHPNTAMSLENIGLLHEKRGNKIQAYEYVQRAASLFEKTLGPDHPNTREAQHNLLRIRGDDEGTVSASHHVVNDGGCWRACVLL